MNWAIEFLTALSVAVPPNEGRSHGLLLRPDGRLIVCIAETERAFVFSDEDLTRPTADVAADIKGLLGQ